MISLNGLSPRQQSLTIEGAKELAELLQTLKGERLKVASEIRTLTSQSGSNALEESVRAVHQTHMGELNDQIALINHIMATAKVMAKPNSNQLVQFGSRVALKIGGALQRYHLVGSLEIDPSQGKISTESPIGGQLLGKKLNDSIELQRGGKRVVATITGIE